MRRKRMLFSFMFLNLMSQLQSKNDASSILFSSASRGAPASVLFPVPPGILPVPLVARLLAPGGCRLLEITGPGAVGSVYALPGHRQRYGGEFHLRAGTHHRNQRQFQPRILSRTR